MSYAEIIVQERSDTDHATITHRHLRIDGPRAVEYALEMLDCAKIGAHQYNCITLASHPLKPCSLCAQQKPEAPHDHNRS